MSDQAWRRRGMRSAFFNVVYVIQFLHDEQPDLREIDFTLRIARQTPQQPGKAM
ncbi:hypothetical protein [Massilia sp. Root335]|uniref:hypothetical protein n=1 Tax=Massilia sp. Root335 TaxID=1736517 RepID=UPI000AF2C70E|nr:hypothetical protein [Massilia sp. Root335]